MNGLGTDPLDSALIRLRVGDRVLGAGFLIAPDVLATCAHVVDGETPVADFPMLRSHDHAVQVLEQDNESDVAILRLVDPPPGALPVPARISGEVRDHRFRTFGFPRELPDGVWVTGRLVGAQGAGRIQMAQDPDHWHIEPGFSGAPVWDEELAGVVGMVATFMARNRTVAHLVPTTALGDTWTTPTRNPYRGLHPFEEEDAALFHGRDDDIDRLALLLERQDVVAIAGPSGSGKSSLVKAGLIPRLRQAGAHVVEIGPDEGIPDPPTPGTVLILDQFEEAVVVDPAGAREKLTAITRLVAEHGRQPDRPRAVLTLRSRSLDDLITKETVAELNRAVWFLEPMSPDQLTTAIEGPAATVGGLAFESGLVQRILNDTTPEPGALPLMSLVLDQLWRHRHGGWLTHEVYDRLGRVPGALSNAADHVLASLVPRQRGAARRLLTALARADGEGGFVRRAVRLADLDPQIRDIAHDLATKRLVVIQDRTVNLTHQALIDHWPQLRNWLADDAEFLHWRAKLHDLQGSGGMLRDAPLAEAAGWLRARPQDIPEHQQQFIRRSAAAQRRTQNRWRTTTAALTTLMLIAAVLIVVVVRNNSELDDRLRSTNASTMAQTASRTAATDPVKALQLALAAWREKPDSPYAYGALFEQRVYWHGVDRVIPPDLIPDPGVWAVLSSADGRVLVIYPEDRAKRPVAWWDLHGPNPRHRELPVDPANSPPAAVTLSPDGRFLAVNPQGNGNGLRLLELTNPDEPVTLTEHDDVTFVDFSWNSRFLSAKPADDRQPVRIWDLTTRRELPGKVTFGDIPGEDPVQQIHPSPDGTTLITKESHVSANGEREFPVVVRDVATGARLNTYPAGTPGDSTTMLVGGGTLLVRCDATGLHALEPLTGRMTDTLPDVKCSDVNTDLTGQYLLATGGQAGTARQIIHWSTWQRTFTRAWDTSGEDRVLMPRNDRELTVISSRNGVMEVSTAATTTETGGYDRYVASPDKKRWAAYSADTGPAGLGLAVLDDSGTVLASTTIPAAAGMSPYSTPGRMSFDAEGERIAVASGPKVRTYRAAGLLPEHELELPLPPGHSRSELDHHHDVSMVPGPDGGLVASAWGVLSFWDLRTGTQTRPPLVLEQDSARGGLPDSAKLAARPGHPEQVLVMTGGRLALWDVRARKSLGEFLFGETQSAPYPVVSADGALASAESVSSPTKVIDLDTLTVRAEINTAFDDIIGFSGNYLFHFDAPSGQVWTWDLTGQRPVSGGSRILTADAAPAIEDDAFLPERRPGRRHPIPLNPDEWFTHLCHFADRDFTEQEIRALPPGVSHNRPCE